MHQEEQREFVTCNKTKQGVCHTVTLPFTLESVLNAKEELLKIQIFHRAKM